MPSDRSLRLTPAANADLTDLLQLSAEWWGEEQMLAYAAEIYEALEHLARFPFLDRTRDDLAKGLRGYLVNQHMVFNRVTDDEVIIRRIIHHQRDLESGVIIATL